MKRVFELVLTVGFLGLIIGLGVFEAYAEQTRQDNAKMKVIIQHRIERLTPGVYGTYGYTCLTGTPSCPEVCDLIKKLEQMQDAL
jgi:hypothetical protein